MPDSLLVNLDLVTGRRLAAAPGEGVLLTSAGLGWRGIVAELHGLEPTRQPAHAVQTHRLMVHRGPPSRFEFRDGGDRWRGQVLRDGDVTLLGHGAQNEPRWHDPMLFLAIGLDAGFVARCFGDGAVGGDLRLDPIRGRADGTVVAFADLLQREIAAPAFSGLLYGETLALGLARHLLSGRSGAGPRGVLTGAQIRRVVARLADDLTDDVGLEALAAEAHVSPFHFARLFRAATGLPPHQYVLRLRIDRAKRLLRAGRGASLTEVALAAGFFDHPHFTRTFKRIVGVTPSAFAALH